MSRPGNPRGTAEEPSIAERIVRNLHACDHTALSLGITILDIQPGRVVLGQQPRDNMANGHAIVHGGHLFLLADTAFAYALATRGKPGVSAHATMTFLAPARTRAALVATASEQFFDGRTGIYDVTVATSDGTNVALGRFYGKIPKETT